jgi:hypothetical protein
MNFTSKEFKDYCEGLGIILKFASVAHPKTNRQVEKANGLICSGIKKRLLAPLEKAKHAWIDESPSVLWSLRTTPNAATQETPFFLVHGAEAVLPVEITHEAPRITTYDEITSSEALQDDVDALDEARNVALARATQYQQSLRNYHSSRVRPRSFVVGDLVLGLKQDHCSKNHPICRLISRLIVNHWVSDKIIAYRSALSPRLIYRSDRRYFCQNILNFTTYGDLVADLLVNSLV